MDIYYFIELLIVPKNLYYIYICEDNDLLYVIYKD